MRAVLDPNVLVSAIISPAGPRGSILLAWTLDEFELVISSKLLDELADVLDRPKLQRWVSQATASEYLDALTESATMIDDPPDPPKRSAEESNRCFPPTTVASGAMTTGATGAHGSGVARRARQTGETSQPTPQAVRHERHDHPL